MATKKTIPAPAESAKKASKAAKPKEPRRRGKPAPAEASAKRVSALDAAARVLGETKQALSCPELIATMAAQGYWTSPAGKTPSATLASAIQREIKLKGGKARFKKTEPGRFTLA
jgi:hypothetical protein